VNFVFFFKPFETMLGNNFRQFCPFCCRATNFRFSSNSQTLHAEKSSDDNNSTTVKPLGGLVKRSELPILEKFQEPNEQKILAKSRTEILAQIENGKTVRVPFRLWQIAIRKCYIPHQSYKDLTLDEREIYVWHMEAVQNRKLTYKDPKTKNLVMTITALILQEKCCGNACRHCPYEHVNVPEATRHKKVFNGAFYV